MKFYLHGKILVGIIVSILVVLGLGLISYLYFNKLLETIRWGTHARKVLYHAEEIRSSAIELETAQRGFALTGQDVFLNMYRPAIQAIYSNLTEMDSLVADNANQVNRLILLRDAVKRRIEFSDEVLAARKVEFEKARDLVATQKGKRQTDEIKALLNDIKTEENNLIAFRSLRARDQFVFFVSTFVALMFVIIALLITITVMINGNLKWRTLSEEKLKQAEQETKKVNQELEAFTYSASHDLRAPLRSIDGYAQILKEDYSDKLDTEANRIIHVITSNAQKMGQLIDDLLDFSRLGKQEIRKSKVDTQEFVKSIIDDLMQAQNGRQIQWNIQPLFPMLADVNMIRQVWINLLSNALKYSLKKDKVYIEIGCLDQADKSTFYVKDNGAGFDMQYQNKLFGVFQRLHKASDYEGTGVGLALVKRIVERHHGRVWAEAKVNEGATFYFTIPKQ